MATANVAALIDKFHTLYYGSGRQTWKNTYWLGHSVQKCPLDLWVYQEILYEVRPELIIETGTYRGGSALFLASICDLLGQGEVITVDIKSQPERPQHPRITYLTGSSVSDQILQQIRSRAAGKDGVFVVLDSNHYRDHVLAELQQYAPLVTAGSYIVVEDTNVNGHPILKGHGPGPQEAVDEFLLYHDEFERDEDREKFLMTFNPGGYLKKKRRG